MNCDYYMRCVACWLRQVLSSFPAVLLYHIQRLSWKNILLFINFCKLDDAGRFSRCFWERAIHGMCCQHGCPSDIGYLCWGNKWFLSPSFARRITSNLFEWIFTFSFWNRKKKRNHKCMFWYVAQIIFVICEQDFSNMAKIRTRDLFLLPNLH